MSVLTAFADYLDEQSVATLGQDLKIGGAPDGRNAPPDVFWLVRNGGATERRGLTGELIKRHNILVYFRSADPELVDTKLSQLEALIDSDPCMELEGFTMAAPAAECEAPYTDNDLDDARRKAGMIQVILRTYN